MSTRQLSRTLTVLVAALTVTSVVAGGVTFAAGTAAGQTGSGDVLYRVNAGGSAVAASSGPGWVADASGSQYSSSGSAYTASSLAAGDVTNPTAAPSSVFLTERYGDHSWSFDVTAGESYEVRLYVAEIYHGVSTSGADAGDRVFDVAVEGQQFLDGYDLVAETGGAATATVETVEVTPSDGTLDVSLSTVTDNAKVSAIEIVEAGAEPGVVSGPSGVDFETTVVGESATETVTVSNEGEDASAPAITVDDVSVTGADAGDFSAGSPSATTLAPGDTAEIPVTFAPSSAQAKSATLEVSHDAPNATSPLTVDLSGEGASDVPIGFGSSELDLSGVSVDSVDNPTSLQFGPDGRLYVSQQNGIIYAFDVQRNGANDYEATSVETITTIKNDIPNHNDDGGYNSQQIRQVTGFTVAGTASQPVLYVSSSDWRISTGNTDPPSQSLDTNSGVISRLTETGSGWDHTMLVRGLPRSEENHAPNGLALDAQDDVLYLAEGGHTNMGTPSNFFSNIPEYAYSGAILSIDLAAVESMSEKSAANTDVPYNYDLPTLAPGQTSTDGPFGGLDGDNMAVLEQDSPVQVYAPGFRNPYDVHLTEDGQLYSVDNGPNGGLGGPPTQACEAAAQNSGSTYDDNLHYISEEGYYAGHPNPVRGNSDYVPGAVYDGYDGAGECEYLVPGEEDGALATFGSSTNGLTEYTTSNFGGAMQGDLLTSSFDGNIYRVQLDGQGDGLTEDPTPLLSSGGTLDVTAQGDGDPFPGTVWSAERTDNAIQVFEPNDYDGSDGDQQCDLNNPDGDADGDGYTNEDEQTVGTDPCSAGSVPADYDDDGNPDQLDSDDDDDGLSDSEDPFALDPDNGKSTELPVELTFNPSVTYPNTIPSATGGTDGLGFTGLMTNGEDPYSDLYEPEQVFAGGQAQILSVSEVPQGDAYQTPNDQQYAFQFGVDTANVSQPFTVHTTVAGFPEDPQTAQSAGMFLGTGDQDNYLKLVVSAAGGTGGVQLATETGSDGFTDVATPSDSNVTGSGTATDLFLTVDPTTDPSPDNGVDEYEVTATYTVDGGAEQTVGTTAAPAAWFTDGDQGLAIGVISTSNLASSTFSAAWEQLSVQSVDGGPAADAGAAQTVDEGTTVELDASGSSGDSLSYSWTETSNAGVSLSDADTATPTFTAPDVDGETTLTFEVEVSDGAATDTDTVDVTVQDADTAPADGDVQYRVNVGGPAITVDDGPDWSGDTADSVSQYLATSPDAGGQIPSVQPYTVGGVDESVPDDTPTQVFETERYDPDAQPNMLWSFPVEQGATYEVRLHFHDGFDGTSAVGDRVFGVDVEEQSVRDDFDVIEAYGDNTAGTETVTVTPDDDTLNVTFLQGVENPQVNGIEVVNVSDAGDGGDGDAGDDGDNGTDAAGVTSADVAITPGSGIAASTFNGGSYQVTNTGETNVTTLRVDLNETLLPDMVHDPFNTAGDNVGKEFTLDSGDVTVEDVAYTNVHNGVDNDEGYDSLVVTLSGFAPGETMTFSLDNDPTSIDTTTLGSQAAGPVSGLELFGGTVAVGDGSGDLVAGTVVGDGSAGGAQATLTNETGESPPTIDVADANLSGTTLSDRHTAATVTDANRTVAITDAPANATVTLLRAEAELNLTNVPNPVEVEAYEGNTLVDVTYQTVQTDANGTATVDVTLTNSTASGGQNYLAAYAEEAEGDTGPASNYVVLDLVDNSEPTIGSITDQGVTEGESVAIDANAADADGDALTYSVDGPDFVTVANGTVEVAPGDGSVGTYDVTVTASDGAASASESFAVYVDEPDVDGEVVFAANAGGPAVNATDGTTYQAGSATDALADGSTYSTGQAVANTEDDALYQTERYGGASGNVAPNLSVPVENGTYEITLQFAEIFQGVSGSDAPDSAGPTDGTNENDRQFDVTVEGEQVLTAYDPFSEVGPLTATDKRYTVAVTDGDLDVGFVAVADNAKLSAVRVEAVGADDGNAAPTVDPIPDQTVTETESVAVAVNASDADGDALGLSLGDAPAFASLADDGDGTATLTLAPGAGDAGTYTVELVASDGTANATETVTVTVEADSEPGPEGPDPVGDFEDAPTDPDGDGVYEDVNGDGSVNVNDAQALFANLDDPVVQDDSTVDAFDVNGDGSVNVNDAQALFDEVTGGS